MHSISIAHKLVGAGAPCFIIAEAGVNHNGDPALARQLILAAAEAGADAVKFQTFRAEKLVTASAKMASYQVANTGKERSQFEMLKALELPYEAHADLKSYAESLGLIFMSTPFDEEAIDFLAGLHVPVFKAGSGDLTNLPYLRRMAAKGIPMILSTGMATLEEAREAVETVRAAGNDQLVVLHCTTNYPCPPEEVNLRAMQTIAQALGTIPGYSDHTPGVEVSVLAVAAGAAVIEKHYTLDRNMEGPDHKASLEPAELKAMIAQIRAVEQVLGHGRKEPFPSEREIMSAARKSVVTARAIAAGELITADMLCIKRPGTGLHPRNVDRLVGLRATRALEADVLVQEGDFV